MAASNFAARSELFSTIGLKSQAVMPYVTMSDVAVIVAVRVRIDAGEERDLAEVVAGSDRFLGRHHRP